MARAAYARHRRVVSAAAEGRPGRRAAIVLSVLSVVALLVLVYVGSRGLKDFDAALIGYAVAVVFAVAGLVYRYTLWISRPPTWRYFKAGWTTFFSWRNFRKYMLLVPRAWWTDIFAQTFIRQRSTARWIMHLCIFWGVVFSLFITVPLSFGWIHFTIANNDQDYRIWFFGISLFSFQTDTVFAFIIFHALDFTAALLLIGLGMAFWRRATDAGLQTTQRFGFDMMPILLLFAIAITGIALTFSSALWHGEWYTFVALVHEVVVVSWLLSLPFGKFFHIVERPATIGITLYNAANEGKTAKEGVLAERLCRECGEGLPSAPFVADLKATLAELGQDYDLGDGRGSLMDYCPTCKRLLRGHAYYAVTGTRFV